MYDCDTKVQNEVTQNRPQSQHPIPAYNTDHFFARFSFQIKAILTTKKTKHFEPIIVTTFFDKKMFKNVQKSDSISVNLQKSKK